MKNLILLGVGLLITSCAEMGPNPQGQIDALAADVDALAADLAGLQTQQEALQALVSGLEGGTTLELIDPCPEVSARFREVLACVGGGTLLALYYSADAEQAFFAELPPGTYSTTDSRACRFRVVEGCELD